MDNTNYDDPKVEEQWCDDQREHVREYLEQEGISHGRIGEWPAWHIAPLVSVWAIESKENPEWVGWWVICGDLPTDYVSAELIKDPREAVRAFSQRWQETASCMARGESHPEVSIGEPQDWPELGPLIKARADILAEWVEDDSLWTEIE